MNTHFDNSLNSHRQTAALLPWYVNKTLSGQELKMVENHLSACLVCKREIRQLEKLAQAVKRDNRFDSAENASFLKLKQRISSDRKEQDKVENKIATIVNFDEAKQSKRRLILNPLDQRTWAIAAMLLLAVLLPLSYMKSGALTPLNEFKTLSDGKTEKSRANEIRVVFADTLDVTTKAKVVAAIDGKLVGEPSLQGVYTVSLAENLAQGQILDKIAELRKDNRVVFAEPAYALLVSGQTGGK